MLPDGKFSSPAPRSAYLSPDNLQGYTRRLDYERGGRAIGDASAGLNFQDWRVYYDDIRYEVRLANETGFDQAMFSSIGLTQLALAFDFNMRPVIAYTENEVTWLRQFNTSGEQTSKLLIPAASQPRLCLDDKRVEFATQADILLFYLRANNICMRVQREGFLTEHILATDVVGTRLGRVGMTTGWRVQLELLP